MGLKRREWMLVGVLLTVVAGYPALVQGQVATTTVQDTVYSANGSPVQGTVVVRWGAFTTADGTSVPEGSTAATIGTGGALSLQLVPDAGATPIGSYYTAVFHLNDGTTSRQFWVVPAVAGGGGPVKLAMIQNQVLPTSVAMQTVSKSYVDNAIAKAVTGVAPGSTATPYVLKTGDTMSGPLLLPGDPVSPQQAADKNYVDATVGQLAGGGSTKVSIVPTSTQTVAQPASTQLEVNRLNGVLDATGFLSAGGNNGVANALASPECTGGCEVRANPTYPGTETLNISGGASEVHVQDARGGALSDTFVNPLGVNANANVASWLSEITTRTAQQMVAARPGVVGPNSFVLGLTQNAPTGGSNQFPASHERVPYAKSNYSVLQLTGNYNTQGQHVQFGNVVNCYSVGDCLAGGQYITSSGGYRDEADEGTHPFDLEVSEDNRVFQGSCASGCTTGSTSLVVAQAANAGTQGDGRFLMDKNPSKVISSGSIVGGSGDLFQTVTFAGTSFPVSVFLKTGQAATSQAGNLQPGTVTLPIATSGMEAVFATSTAALPASTGVACVADPAPTGVFPNFETTQYTVVDATHVRMTLNKVHSSGAMIAVGGLCGYGLEQTVDTMGQVRQVFPVVGSINGTELYYAGALTGVVGYSSPVNTSGYLNASLPVANVARNGNVVTLTVAGSFPYDLNGLNLTVSGVADSSYNGTFTVATTGGNTLTYANAGANSTSTGGNVGILTGGFNLYPMAEVLNVYNPASAEVDGTMTLAPNTVAWAAGDAVEEPHYHQQLVYPDTELVTQFVPRPVQYTSAGKNYGGQAGPGLRGWQITNSVPGSNYLGAGGTHQPPDDAYVASGVWRNTFEMDAGQEAVFRIHCNLRTCSRWDSAYTLFSLDSHLGQDFLSYDPSSDTATWTLAGTTYSFSPGGFSASNISAGTMSAKTVSAGTTLVSASAAAHSVMLGGATAAASADASTVIGGTGSAHVLELLANNGTARNTFTLAATLGGTPTALFELGSGLEQNATRSFYIYDYAQGYVPFYASASAKAVGINTTAPMATLDVGGNMHAASVAVGPTMDTQISRTAPATLSVDDGTAGDSNGSISLSSVLLKDTANGHVYRLAVTNGALTTTQVQ